MKNQLITAREGKMTQEIKAIAKDEGVDVNALRENVAAGKTAIRIRATHRQRDRLQRAEECE